MKNFLNIIYILLAQWIIQIEFGSACSENDIHALILARGGSQGIKHKNLVKINGISLLARSILTIKNASDCFENIWVSTDDENIAKEADKYGALVHNRPAQYAMDNTSSLDAVKEFLNAHQTINNVALFQCTSVFLKEAYIRQAVEKYKSHECVFAVRRSHSLRWELKNNVLIPSNFRIESRPRRQDWSGDMIETGMFYFSRRELVMSGFLQNEKCAVVDILPEDALEIDSYQDLKIARCIVDS
ncbi:N-acylneuraminate cytidylyltransferase A [Scaptodrosophila lebanonensis]|uniref:N-acylneuraminate cytidylyltransferase A n=1 Tax=Drosophila lebanonensis TaxID=7225 RepID=A0A6J2TFY2_DROLE|nr:N-acylneuraminate cytidylyltransferase A [Scaptodrosophila lebanonensis]